ncbi:DNA sulfur modification protein DndB [Saccharospirillum sp.]|uniref:DNA sulfur modification protein DndB n=1 Tax=Saccharospirillum sp. TaxID=2033801 RepID=UPI0034A03D0B
MDILDSLLEAELAEPNFDFTIMGSFGSFHTKNSFEVNYMLCSMNYKEIKTLQVAADAFQFSQVNFDEMVQREIDEKRVNEEIVGQYLEDDLNRALFFPPLIVSLVSFSDDDKPVHKYRKSRELIDEEKPVKVFKKRWDRYFEVEMPVIDQGIDYYKSDYYGNITIYKNAVKLRGDSKNVKLVVIDGQHRLKAVEEYIRRHNEQKDFITLPVCICFSPKAMAENGPEDILDTLRNMFVTINNKGKQVSGHYLDLLNDNSLASQTVRSLANMWKKERQDSLYSKLQFMEWNQRSDSQSRRVNRAHSITTVSMLAESLRVSVFESRKSSNLDKILRLTEDKTEFYDPELSVYDIREDHFSYKQKDALYNILEQRVVPSLDILFTEPSVFKKKISSYNAAISDCYERSQKSQPGYSSFIDIMRRFGDVDKKMHSDETVSASNSFYKYIYANEHAENYTRLVFNQAYLRAWADLMCVSHHFLDNVEDYTRMYINSLEEVCFDERRQVFSKSRIYNQNTLYKGAKPNTTIMGKDSWYHLLMMTILSGDSLKKIKEYLESRHDTNHDFDKVIDRLTRSKNSFIEVLRDVIHKDNLQNWKVKDYPSSFRRELADCEARGDNEQIAELLNQWSKEQLNQRLVLLSNVIEIDVIPSER